MAVTYKSSGNVVSGRDASIKVPVPAGHSAGDFLLMLIYTGESSVIVPTGWTLAQVGSNSDTRVSLLYKITGGSEPIPTVNPQAGRGDIEGMMHCFSGVDTLSPIHNNGVPYVGGATPPLSIVLSNSNCYPLIVGRCPTAVNFTITSITGDKTASLLAAKGSSVIYNVYTWANPSVGDNQVSWSKSGVFASYHVALFILALNPIPTTPPLKMNIGGVWKPATDARCNIGGVWKEIKQVEQNIGGVWKQPI